MMNREEAQKIIEMLREQGYSTRYIAESCGLSKSCVGRMALGETVRMDAIKAFSDWVERDILRSHEQRQLSVSPQRQIAAPRQPDYVDAEYRIEEYTEQLDPLTNGRVRVPYPQRTIVPYSRPSQPQPYQGTSRYLQSPRTYQRDIQQERERLYRQLRSGMPETFRRGSSLPLSPMQPQPQPSQAETALRQVGRIVGAFLDGLFSR